MPARLRTWLRAVFRRGEWERDLAEELASHVALRAADLVRGGMEPDRAERQARLELGAREAHRESARQSFGLRWIDELIQDLRYAGRTLRRSPLLVAVATLSLGLGIGANTVAFSVLNALILRRPPVAEADRLRFFDTNRGPTLSFPDYRDLRDENRTFDGLAAFRPAPMGLGTAGATRRVWGMIVTGNYFTLLGVEPALGRFFRTDDDRAPGANPVAVLSHEAWRTRFGADSAIVGRTVRINDLAFQVLGVAPPGFFGTEFIYRPELWVPMSMQPQIEGWSWLDERPTQNAMVVGRLAAGVSADRAEADVNRILADVGKRFPATSAGVRAHLTQPGLVGDAGRGPARAFLSGVMALALVVLLAAIVNLTSLIAARTRERSREIALRVSIGAGRGRVLRQLTTETLLLSLIGAGLGWVGARAILGALSRWELPIGIPLRVAVEPDGRVFGFALLVTVAIGLVVGAASARQAWGVDLVGTLKNEPGARRVRRGLGREALLGLQVAMATVLLTATAASIRGLTAALRMPIGFERRGLAVAGFDQALEPKSREEMQAFQRRVIDQVARLPGVTSAALAAALPLTYDHSRTSVFPDGTADFRASSAITATDLRVSPGYFETLRTPIVAGRAFTWHDDQEAPLVAVVNRAFGRQVFGETHDDGLLGRRYRWTRDGPAVLIVGVVPDGKYTTLTEDPRPAVFRPLTQAANSTALVVARSSAPVAATAELLRETLTRLDPHVPLFAVGSVDQLTEIAFLPSQVASWALGAFGLLAVMLAVTGIYGTAAYVVSRRAREIGVRVALGARPVQVLRFTLGRTALVLLAGSLAGLALAAAAARLLESVVYQASARDPWVLLLAAVAMAVVGLLAALSPALRALSLDPLKVLRAE